MRIMFLNKAPKNSAKYDVTSVEKLLNSYASEGTRVEVHFPENFAGSAVEDVTGNQKMLNGLDHMMETPSLIRKICWAAENGFDAVIQSNTFDPGIDGGRLVVKIPVIGPLRTTVHAAAVLADRIGITVPLPSHVPYTWRLLRTIGMDHMVTDIRALDIYGSGHQRTPCGDHRNRHRADPGSGRGDRRGMRGAAGRRADPLRRRSRRSAGRRGCAGAQYQGGVDPLRRSVRRPWHEPQSVDLSSGGPLLQGPRRGSVGPARGVSESVRPVARRSG